MLGYTFGARKKKRKSRSKAGCTTVIFKRRKKGGKVLPRSQWIEVERCPGKKLKGKNKDQCRIGGTGKNAHLFAKCTPGKRRARRKKRR